MSMCWVNEELHRIIRDFPLHFFLIFLPVTTSHGLRSLLPDRSSLKSVRHSTYPENYFVQLPVLSPLTLFRSTSTMNDGYNPSHMSNDSFCPSSTLNLWFYESANSVTYYVSNLILFLFSRWYTLIHSDLMLEHLHLCLRPVLTSCIFSTLHDFS